MFFLHLINCNDYLSLLDVPVCILELSFCTITDCLFLSGQMSCNKIPQLLIHSSSDSSACKILKLPKMKNIRWYFTIKLASWSYGVLWMKNILFTFIIRPFWIEIAKKKKVLRSQHQAPLHVVYLTSNSKYINLYVFQFLLAHLFQGSQVCKYGYCWLACQERMSAWKKVLVEADNDS